MTVLDAWGRKVEELGNCARCGASIKYIFTFEGQTYGSTCIEAVSGIKPDQWIDGDEEKTRLSLAKKQFNRQQRIDANEKLEALRDGIRKANQEKFSELINVLRNASRYSGDFCSEMARSIETDGFSTELYKGILSPKAFIIVREIWGKTTGGRKNSKAYNEAIEEFDKKFDNLD